MKTNYNPGPAVDPRIDARAQAKADKAYRKASRPWFKKKRYWVGLAIILLIIWAATNAGGNDDSTSAPSGQSAQQPVEPAIQVTADQLMDELEANALAASNNYEGKRVTVSGKLSNIDSSGDYFAIQPSDGRFTVTSIKLNIEDHHLETVQNFTKGQEVTATGKVTSVGEVMGYSIDVETIN